MAVDELVIAPAVLAWLLALLPVPQAAGAGQEQPDRPQIYPYLLDAVDALQGFLLDGPFQEPTSVFLESTAGELYVADSKSALIGIFDLEGSPLFSFGRTPLLSEPRQVAAAGDGTIFVLDAADSQVHVFNYRGEPRGTLAFEYPAIGDVPGGTAAVSCFAFDPEGRWFVGDRERAQVLAYAPDLSFRFAIRTARAAARFENIVGMSVSPEGLLAVIDLGGTPVQVFDAQGRFLTGFGKRDLGVENFTGPIACGFDGEGYLFVVDLLRHDVKIFEPSGAFRGFFGGWFGPQTRGRGPGEMRYPNAIAFGPQGRVWVAERFGRRVQVFHRRPRGEPALQQPAVGRDDGR